MSDNIFQKEKLALRKYLSENRENAVTDLEEMREKSNDSQETLDEAAKRYDGENAASGVNSFIAGAKWMERQMESLKDFDVWKEWKNTKSE